MQNIKEIKQEDLSKCYLNCIRSMNIKIIKNFVDKIKNTDYFIDSSDFKEGFNTLFIEYPKNKENITKIFKILLILVDVDRYTVGYYDLIDLFNKYGNINLFDIFLKSLELRVHELKE